MRLVVAVRCILMYKDDIWLSTDKMFQDGHYYRCSDSDMVLLKHSLSVERVGLIHNCTGNCTLSGARTLNHSPSLFNGGNFKVLFQSDGFPLKLG